MWRQGRGFPKAVSSIVSSHHPASRVRISLTLTDNWKCCIVFSSSPAFVLRFATDMLLLLELKASASTTCYKFLLSSSSFKALRLLLLLRRLVIYASHSDSRPCFWYNRLTRIR